MALFPEVLRLRRQRVEVELARCLDSRREVPPRLAAAIRYAVLNGGKRLRPLLAYAAAEAAGGDIGSADVPACAVELIHAYSLIHDDLPAMDDDVLRRGQPTCHVVFGEATAILAGDALQSLAFELLASSPRLSCGHGLRLQLVSELARASGASGMAGGQALDIAATGGSLTEAQLGHMHGLKTGALIAASVVLGALATNLASADLVERLRAFARLTGLAFQIRDDILDVESATAITGKQQGKDAALAKVTYPALLGLDGARRRLQQSADEADALLAVLGPAADSLRELARHMAQRSS